VAVAEPTSMNFLRAIDADAYSENTASACFYARIGLAQTFRTHKPGFYTGSRPLLQLFLQPIPTHSNFFIHDTSPYPHPLQQINGGCRLKLLLACLPFLPSCISFIVVKLGFDLILSIFFTTNFTF
jgi:hypothetical protein